MRAGRSGRSAAWRGGSSSARLLAGLVLLTACGDDASEGSGRDAGDGRSQAAADDAGKRGQSSGSGGSGGRSATSGAGGSRPGSRDGGPGGGDGSIPQPEPDGGHPVHHEDATAPECAQADDCAAPASECATAACRAGRCEHVPLAAGKRAAAQTAGDCLEAVCDGAGALTVRADPGDVVDDGVQCTVDACSAGAPTHEPATARSACSQGGGQRCDGAGHCVECTAGGDCASTFCQDGACRPQPCGNLTKDNGESDVDCGGPCTPCDPGEACNGASDCKGQECGPASTCVANCMDGVLDNSEVAVDCGPGCAKCSNGKTCSSHDHCASGFCHPTQHQCAMPTCRDEFMNGNETGKDCGGSCPACAPAGCTLDGECPSGICYGGSCRENVNGCTPATAQDLTSLAAVTVTFPTGGLAYSPRCIKVRTGTTVTFMGSVAFSSHPLTGGIVVSGSKMPASSGPFTPATSSTDTSKAFTLGAAGSYPYYCNFHGPSGMHGAVFVVAP